MKENPTANADIYLTPNRAYSPSREAWGNGSKKKPHPTLQKAMCSEGDVRRREIG